MRVCQEGEECTKMAKHDEWTPFSWHCVNCGTISTGLSEKGNKKRAEKILMDLRKTFQPPVDQTARIISGLSSEMMFSDYMLQWLEIVG